MKKQELKEKLERARSRVNKLQEQLEKAEAKLYDLEEEYEEMDIKEHNDGPTPDALQGHASIASWERANGRGFWGNATTGYIYDDDQNKW